MWSFSRTVITHLLDEYLRLPRARAVCGAGNTAREQKHKVPVATKLTFQCRTEEQADEERQVTFSQHRWTGKHSLRRGH